MITHSFSGEMDSNNNPQDCHWGGYFLAVKASLLFTVFFSPFALAQNTISDRSCEAGSSARTADCVIQEKLSEAEVKREIRRLRNELASDNFVLATEPNVKNRICNQANIDPEKCQDLFDLIADADSKNEGDSIGEFQILQDVLVLPNSDDELKSVTEKEIFDCGQVTQIPVNECWALWRLYQTAKGDKWSAKHGWTTSYTPCSWFGITCENGHVTRIILRNNNVDGTLTGDLAYLEYLEEIDVGNRNPQGYNSPGMNRISGFIPYNFVHFKRLEILRMDHIQFRGPITPDLGNVSPLKVLDLSGNYLAGTELPETFANMDNLEYLDLSSSGLTGSIPEVLGEMEGLKYLDLSMNDFEGEIPESFGKLSFLEELDLEIEYSNRGPKLSGPVPFELSNLTNLKYLNLNNQGTYWPYPEMLGMMDSLERFCLRYNQFVGPLPDNIGNLSNLIELDLKGQTSSNKADFRLSGQLPESIGNLTSLEILNLSDNILTGHIPGSLGQLENLKFLSLAFNDFESVDSELFGGLVSLEFLSLSANSNLHVTISTHWGSMSKIKNIFLNGTQTGGSLPEELGNWTEVIELGIGSSGDKNKSGQHVESNQKVEGPLPNSIGNWTSVEEIDLANQRLSGPIPASIGNLKKLTTLSVNKNQIGGTLPPSMAEMESLVQLDLSENNIEGSIPPEFGNFKRLRYVNLSYNSLSGEIPTDLGSLTYLREFYASNNNLSGNIPKELLSMWPIEDLDLSNNKLTGPLPKEIDYGLNFDSLILGSNSLTGSLPARLSISAGMEYLDFSNNQITGTIPAEFARFERLTTFWANGNELTGMVPLEFVARTSPNDGGKSKDGSPVLCCIDDPDPNPYVWSCRLDNNSPGLFIPDIESYRPYQNDEGEICRVPLTSPDLDGDGILDYFDNCLSTPNPYQEDLDGDAVGYACDVSVDAEEAIRRLNEDLGTSGLNQSTTYQLNEILKNVSKGLRPQGESCGSIGFYHDGQVAIQYLQSFIENLETQGDNSSAASALATSARLLTDALGTGRVSYAQSNGINVKKGDSFNSTVFPNPGNPNSILRFCQESDGTTEISVFDLTGRAVYIFETNSTAGWHNHAIGSAPLASGMYIYRVVSPDKILTGKFSIIK